MIQMYRDSRWTVEIAQDAVMHDPKTGQFSSAQGEAHEHLIKAGHVHQGRSDKTGSHSYKHPNSQNTTEVHLSGGISSSSPPQKNYKKTSGKEFRTSANFGRMTPEIAARLAK